MAEHTYGKDTRYPEITLSERQWDIVRDALIQRGTKAARTMAEKIWQQGGGTHNDGGEWQPEWERRLTSGEIDAEHNDGQADG